MKLIDTNGNPFAYSLQGTPIQIETLAPDASRVIYAAAHVVANPLTTNAPSGKADVDWEKTLAFRRYLAGLGLGIAEAMDTAQRGMGLDWAGAIELIRLTRTELPDALVANGVGTDHLHPDDAHDIEDVHRAYFEQLEAVQKLDARVILMASRALARHAKSADDFHKLYGEILSAAEYPVILHWLGEMFDPALAGYWGSDDFATNLDTVVAIIESNSAKIDGIKISLLDKDKEIALRDRLPEGVKMYTGDDFNYPMLIAGDRHRFSHALLGIFDPLAPLVAKAISALDSGDVKAYHALFDPTVPLAREIFSAPTQYYKTGVVFLAWLNGFQDHFVMLGGAQAMRSLPHFSQIFMMADQNGLLQDPDLAKARMRDFTKIYGLS